MSGRPPVVLALVVLVVLVVLAAACSDDGPPDPQPSTTRAAGTAVDDLEAGTCLAALPEPGSTLVAPVDCTRAHRAEVYAVFDLEADGSPSATEVDALAAGGCTERYEAYAGEPVDPTTERAFAELVPSSASWEEGDRRVVCLALPPGGATAEGSIAATAP